ncbi:MAG: hypothetical protein ACLPKB_06795 [Xanthobacteraceae bacterium]
MRKTILSGAAALAVIGAGAFAASGAGAVTLSGTSLRPAIESLGSVDTISCRRHGSVRQHCGSSTQERSAQEFSSENRPRADAPVPHRYFSRW